jgi:predicted nucleic acid-binding protein
VRETVEAVKKFASVISVDEEICLEGSRIKAERRKRGYANFGLIDGLILAAARLMRERVLTFDRDYSGERDCTILT